LRMHCSNLSCCAIVPAGTAMAKAMDRLVAASSRFLCYCNVSHDIGFWSFFVKKVFAAAGAMVWLGMSAAQVHAAPPQDPGTPIVAPLPPRMLDPATSTVEDTGARSVPLRSSDAASYSTRSMPCRRGRSGGRASRQ
jgi:hypothetical protein